MRGGSHPDGTTDIGLHFIKFGHILHDKGFNFRRQFVRDADTRSDIQIDTNADFAFIRLRHDFRTNQPPQSKADDNQRHDDERNSQPMVEAVNQKALVRN